MFLTIVMIIPLHRFRIFVLRCFRMKIGKHCAICRNVDIRSPYRIEIGEHCMGEWNLAYKEPGLSECQISGYHGEVHRCCRLPQRSQGSF